MKREIIMRAFLVIVVLLVPGCVAQQQREAVQAGITCVHAVYMSPEAAP